jgi:phage terminase large subunit
VRDILGENISAYKQGYRYIVDEGGTRSGKTFAILTLAHAISMQHKQPHIFSVVSETYPHLKRGAIRDFKEILQGCGAWNPMLWNKTESQYQTNENNILEFFSCDSPGKVHGPARKFLFINEAQNISYEVFKQLAVRTTGTIFIDFNPTFEFWAHKELKNDESCKWIHSTYQDNPYLTDSQIIEIEKGRNNKYWWDVYGLGKVGRLEGVIFDNWVEVDEYPEQPRNEVYGLDFGFSNDPTALVKCCFNDGKMFIKELLYSTGMTNSDICEHLHGLGVDGKIFGDSAEPKSIEEIYRQGFNIHPCVKGKDSIMTGIQKMQQYDICVTKDSLNLIKELRNYQWQKDKNENKINKPIDSYNHLIDAIRYALTSQMKRQGGRAIILD